MLFYLGTHMPNWLSLTDVPLFVSHRRLAGRRTLPVPLGEWALDSGGFTELSMFGEWRTSPAQYAEAVGRYHAGMPGMMWAAGQDWMCEDWIVAKTGRSVAEHQERTVENLLELRALGPGLPFIPTLQGQTADDYHRHAAMWESAGVRLGDEPTVGIGSVCRRQSTAEIEDVLRSLAALGLRLHGFGVKTGGMAFGRFLASADSMAWSYNARKNPPMPGHPHKSCANCLPWALRWRERVLRSGANQQLSLWEAA